MQNINQGTSLALNFGENGTVYGCGHSLDTCLYAFGLSTEEELYEMEEDARVDTIEQTLKDFDWEESFLKKFNDMTACSALTINGNETSPEIVERSDYLPGDWLKFCTEVGYFDDLVKKWSDEIKEIVREGDDAQMQILIPSELLNALEKNLEYMGEEMTREWLNGDRSNPGALSSLMKAMFNSYDKERIEWVTKTDTIHFSNITEDEIRDFYAYDLEDDVPLPKLEEIEQYMREKILAKAHLRKENEQVKRQNRAEEYERQRQRRQAEAEQEKEEARQRKLEKLGKK